MNENFCAAGAHASVEDNRDFSGETAVKASSFNIPDEYDFALLDKIPVVYQKKLGICVAEWIAFETARLYFVKTGTYVQLSAAFIYLVIKRFFDLNTDEGTSMRNALRAAQKFGICPESVFPTNTDLSYEDFVAQPIPEAAFGAALPYRIGAYYNFPVDSSFVMAATFKFGALGVRYEVGKEWYTSVEGRPTWAYDLILPLRAPQAVISGHAIALTGYSLADLLKINFRNWWSTLWGLGGNGYTYFENYPPTEIWAVTLDPIVPPKQEPSSPEISQSTFKSIMNILRKFAGLPGSSKGV